MSTTAVRRRLRRRRAVGGQSRAFRLLWAGQGVSLLGDQITLVALPLVALGLGASVAQVAALAVAGRAPFLLLTLPAGVWVGRLGLRRSMLGADLLRAAALASVPIAAAAGRASYPQLIVVALLMGTGAALFQVAYQSLTPLLIIDPSQLRRANSLLTGTEAVSQTVGPALAGAVISLAGAAWAVILDATSYVASVATLSRMRIPGDQPATSGSSMRAQVAGGVRHVLAQPVLRAILWSSVLFNVGVSGYEALLVPFAIRGLGLSPAVFGLIVGLGGLGVPLGIAAAGAVERRLGVGTVLLLSGTLSGSGLVVAGLASGSGAAATLGAGTFVTAVGGGAWGLTALTARQTLSAPEMRPLTTAVHRWATYGACPLGALLGGLLAAHLGIRTAIVAVAVVGQLAALPLLARAVRRQRHLPSAEPAAATSAAVIPTGRFATPLDQGWEPSTLGTTGGHSWATPSAGFGSSSCAPTPCDPAAVRSSTDSSVRDRHRCSADGG